MRQIEFPISLFLAGAPLMIRVLVLWVHESAQLGFQAVFATGDAFFFAGVWSLSNVLRIAAQDPDPQLTNFGQLALVSLVSTVFLGLVVYGFMLFDTISASIGGTGRGLDQTNMAYLAATLCFVSFAGSILLRLKAA